MVFLSVFVMFFIIIQRNLTPYYQEGTDTIREYFSMQEIGDIDVLFLGTSSPECGIDPMGIYQEAGIPTMSLATAGQSVSSSYYLLEEALKRQNPKYVFFDVASCFVSDDDISRLAFYRYILDSMPLCQSKVELSNLYASYYDDRLRPGIFLSSFFPIYQYHSLWSNIPDETIDNMKARNLYSKGYYLLTMINPSSSSKAEMNAFHVPGHSVLKSNNIQWLIKMKTLCEHNGAELVLLKVPVVISPYNYYPAWTTARSKAIKSIAKRIGLDYIDLLYDEDLEFDWSYDSIDAGCHLNYGGAKKITRWFSKYLSCELDLPKKRIEAFEDDLEIYSCLTSLADLQMTQSLSQYLNKLLDMENTTAFIVSCLDMSQGLGELEISALHNLGLKCNYESFSFGDEYVAIIENKNVKDEEHCSAYNSKRLTKGRGRDQNPEGDGALIVAGVLENGEKYKLTSKGWYIGHTGNIVIDESDYSMKGRGLNIVIYDNISRQVIDSVSFDTYQPGEHIVNRSWNMTSYYFAKYARYLMEKDYKKGLC